MAQKQGKGRKFGRNTRSNSGKMQRIRTEKNKARALEAAKGKPGQVELHPVPTANASSIVVQKNVGQWTAFGKRVKDKDGSVIGYIPQCKDKTIDYHIGYSTLCWKGTKERVYHA